MYHGWLYPNGEKHKGVDYLVATDTDVLAAADGIAISSCQPPLTKIDLNVADTYGNFVLIDHGNGYSTLYAHLNSISLDAGAQLPCDNLARRRISREDIQYAGQTYRWMPIHRGDRIGKVGKTGTTYAHLHFELAANSTGRYEDHVNNKIDSYGIYLKAPPYPPPATKCGNVPFSEYHWTACPPEAAASAPTFGESFDHAPDYGTDWTLWDQHGTPTVTYTAGNFRIQADPICTGSTTGTDILLRSKQAFVGDLDVSFQLNHAGFGRTSVGLASASQNQGVIWSVLDTDDTNYLDFVSGPNATEWTYAGSPYMNRWITLRIQVIGSEVKFYADDAITHELALLQTWPGSVSSPPDSYYLVFGAGSVCWKSGANDTSFRLITANGTLSP